MVRHMHIFIVNGTVPIIRSKVKSALIQHVLDVDSFPWIRIPITD